MKKLLLALLVASPVWAATTDTLLLKGTVPAVLDIDVVPTTLATTLPLDTTQINGYVADVNVKWNTVSGAKVVITSANGGQLRHSSVATSVINYTLQTPSAGTFALTSPQTFSAPIAGPQNITEALGINYTGVPYDLLVEGDYTDTVTFTISAI